LSVAHQFLDREIRQILANPTILQTELDGLSIGHFFPGQIDQGCAGLKAVNQLFVDQVARCFKHWQVQSDDIRFGEE